MYSLGNRFWQETLHMPEFHKVPHHDSLEKLESAYGSDEKDTSDNMKRNSSESLYKNWPLMSSILVYCVFSLHDMAYQEVRNSSILKHNLILIVSEN